jgi:hypothetical protein
MKERRNSEEIEIGFKCVLYDDFVLFFLSFEKKNGDEMSQEEGLRENGSGKQNKRWLFELHWTYSLPICVFGV